MSCVRWPYRLRTYIRPSSTSLSQTGVTLSLFFFSTSLCELHHKKSYGHFLRHKISLSKNGMEFFNDFHIRAGYAGGPKGGIVKHHFYYGFPPPFFLSRSLERISFMLNLTSSRDLPTRIMPFSSPPPSSLSISIARRLVLSNQAVTLIQS